MWSRGAAVAGGLNILSCDITDCSASTDGEGKIRLSISTHPQTPVTAKHLIVESPSSDATSPSVSYHGIYLLSTPLTPLFEKKLPTDAVAPASVVVTFPADQDARAGLGNEAPIYLQVRSAATYECRKGESVVYATTTNEQDRKLLKKVVEMMVGAIDGQAGEEKVVMSCEYSSADLKRETKTQGQVDACGGERVLKMRPLNRDLVFDNEAVEECRKLYEKLVGSREAFCEPPPEFAGFAEGEEED